MSLTFTDSGYRGDIGAQVLLLMAADRAMAEVTARRGEATWSSLERMSQTGTTIPTIRVSAFLKILTGSVSFEAVASVDRLNERTDCMYMRLVQLVQVFVVPGKDQLVNMFNRSTGIVAKVGAQYVDIIIPVLVLRPGETLETVTVTPDRMSVLLVQVKYRTHGVPDMHVKQYCSTSLPRLGSTHSEADKRLNADLDYVSLLIEFGPKMENRTCKSFGRSEIRVLAKELTTKMKRRVIADDKQMSVAINGLQPSHVLAPDSDGMASMDTAFRRLMMASYDPVDRAKGNASDKTNLKLSLAVVYES